jgi:two-component system response regulator MtrA
MRVLVIDDELALSTLASEYLKLSGHEAVACADGESALKILESDKNFDAIILDRRLPGISGAETCRAIKADPGLKAIPLIVLSASVAPGAADSGMPGANLYMAKPFRPKDLLAAIVRLAGGKAK